MLSLVLPLLAFVDPFVAITGPVQQPESAQELERETIVVMVQGVTPQQLASAYGWTEITPWDHGGGTDAVYFSSQVGHIATSLLPGGTGTRIEVGVDELASKFGAFMRSMTKVVEASPLHLGEYAVDEIRLEVGLNGALEFSLFVGGGNAGAAYAMTIVLKRQSQ